MQFAVHYFAILLVVAVLAWLPLVGRIVLGPISRAAGSLKAPTRFLLSDFVWLLVTIQTAFAAAVQLVGVEGRFFQIFLAYITFAVVATWAGAVSFLSRAGVTDAWRRAVFMMVILPGTLAAMIAIPVVIVISAIETGVSRIYSAMRLGWAFSGWEVTRLAMLALLVVAGIGALLWLLRQAAIWVARGSVLDPPPLPDTPERAGRFAER